MMVVVAVSALLLALAITALDRGMPTEGFVILFGLVVYATGPAIGAWVILGPSPLRRRICIKLLFAFSAIALLLVVLFFWLDWDLSTSRSRVAD